MQNKAQIRKVLTSGTAHQRALLLANHLGSWALGDEKGFLTPEEVEALDDSFKTDFDLKTYRKFAKLDERFREVLRMVAAQDLERDVIVGKMGFLNFARKQMVHLTDLLDYLAFRVKEESGAKIQNKIWKDVVKMVMFPLGSKPVLKYEKDDDGKQLARIRLTGLDLPKEAKAFLEEKKIKKTGKELRIDYFYPSMFEALGEKLNEVRRAAKTSIETLREVMKKHSFQVRPYKTLLDVFEAHIREDVNLTGKSDGLKALIKEAKDKEAAAFYQKAYKQLLAEEEETKRIFWKPYDEIEIDEAERKSILEHFEHKDITNGPK